MDQVLGALAVVAVLAAVVVVAVLAARGRFRGEVRGPGGVGASVEGERRSGLRLKRVRAGRNVKGRGSSIDARRIDAGQDAIFEEGGDQDPKG